MIMGGMYKDCVQCKGIGWVESKEKEIMKKSDEKTHDSIVTSSHSETEVVVEAKKRGRKPKGA
jgi:hypothetical protein